MQVKVLVEKFSNCDCKNNRQESLDTVLQKCAECNCKIRTQYHFHSHNGEHAWDDELIDIIEEETGLVEGLDYRRNDDGRIIHLTESSKKVLYDT